MIKKAYIFLFICIVFANSGCADKSVQNEDIQYSHEQLQAVVDEYLEDKTNVLGTIVKIDIHGKESYEAASGYFDSSRTIPVKPNTNFIIGSITKVFTAVLVHQLVEKGHIQLQSPLINYLPPDWSAILKNIEYGNEITVEQALSHRSGIGDMTESEAFMKSLFFDNTKKWNSIDIMKMVQQKKEVKFKPGENFDYCNTNYILLGALIENVSGTSYRESLQKNILARIGLNNTFLVEETFGSHNDTIAHGYSRIDDKLYDGHEIRVEWTLATGGIVSNADDLIKFYRALVSGTLFDSKETYKKMCQLVGHNESYGQGLEMKNDPEIGLYYGHSGNLLNTRTILAYFPEQQMTISICHTYDGFSMLRPESLMKSVVQSMMGYELTEDTEIEFIGTDILADTSNVIENDDMPINGDWYFDLKEEWSLSRVGTHSITLPGNLHMGDNEELCMLLRGSAKIVVLDSDGNLLYSFGGHGDGPQFEYALDFYVTSDNIHVLDMGRTGDKIKTYDKNGNHVKTYKVEAGVSPRIFVNADHYLGLRSGSNILNRPKYELLELISLKQKNGTVLAKIVAEEKIILSSILPMGRYILLEDDIEIFPRLIIHFDKNMLYLGRSDKYLIKKIDLSGKEQLAFSIKGREREALPPNFGVDRANQTRVGRDQKMPEEMKEKFVAQFPDRHTYYTKITTDEEGLIYVFVPDIMDLGKQEIDIFSPEGKYLYHAVIVLPDGLEKIKPFVFKGEHLFALVKSEEGVQKLVKYNIRRPEYLKTK